MDSFSMWNQQFCDSQVAQTVVIRLLQGIKKTHVCKDYVNL